MIKEYVLFGVWLAGLFSIVGLVVICVARMVKNDSTAYDQDMIWGKYSETDHKPPKE